jgi:hypothetical protein
MPRRRCIILHGELTVAQALLSKLERSSKFNFIPFFITHHSGATQWHLSIVIKLREELYMDAVGSAIFFWIANS